MTNKNNKKTFVASKQVVSDMVTEHAKKIGALGPEEKFSVQYVENDEYTVKMDGEVYE